MAFKLYACGVFLLTLLARVNSQVSECRDKLEVVAVVDGSDSIAKTDFTLLKSALIDLARRLDLRTGFVRFGVVLYSSSVENVINLSDDRNLLISEINKLNQPQMGTNTHLGIESLKNMLVSRGRVGVDRIGIVITDGVSLDETATRNQAAIAKAYGITMYSVGVGLIQDKTELRDIASSSERAIEISDYSKLGETLEGLLPDSCPVPTTTTTTRTTRPTPSTTYRPPSSPGSPSTKSSGTLQGDARLCEGCYIRNGIGYIQSKDNCHQFIQCKEEADGTIIAYIKDCPGLTVWDNNTMTCNFPSQTVCENDPCNISPNSYYKKSPYCRHYYRCNDSAARPLCCAQGESFNVDTNSCQSDPSCGGDCLSQFVADPTTTSCNKRPSRLGFYFETLPGTTTEIERPCPASTSFNQTMCDCINRIPVNSLPNTTPANTQCRAELNIKFDGNPITDSANGYWIENVGVTLTNGYGYFNGSSGLRILRFSNFAFGKTFRIKMRYRVEGSINQRQAIVSNRDCAIDGTVSVIVDRSSTSFGMTSETGETTNLPVSVSQQNQWQEVEFDLRNGQLSGSVGSSQAQQTSVNGGIAVSECALQIGRATGFQNFKGSIDYIEVYLC